MGKVISVLLPARFFFSVPLAEAYHWGVVFLPAFVLTKRAEKKMN